MLYARPALCDASPCALGDECTGDTVSWLTASTLANAGCFAPVLNYMDQPENNDYRERDT
jgi:hypothetical protein